MFGIPYEQTDAGDLKPYINDFSRMWKAKFDEEKEDRRRQLESLFNTEEVKSICEIKTKRVYGNKYSHFVEYVDNEGTLKEVPLI